MTTAFRSTFTAAALLALACSAHATLSWSFESNGGSGSVNDNGTSFTLTGSDSADFNDTTPYVTLYTTTINYTGTLDFVWSYSTTDEHSFFDPAGFIVDGTVYTLINNNDTSGGSIVPISVPVLSGQSFSFYVDNGGYNSGGPGVLSITPGATPAPVLPGIPEPATWMSGFALLSVSALARRRSRP